MEKKVGEAQRHSMEFISSRNSPITGYNEARHNGK